jgi:hypothetical protein
MLILGSIWWFGCGTVRQSFPIETEGDLGEAAWRAADRLGLEPERAADGSFTLVSVPRTAIIPRLMTVRVEPHQLVVEGQQQGPESLVCCTAQVLAAATAAELGSRLEGPPLTPRSPGVAALIDVALPWAGPWYAQRGNPWAGAWWKAVIGRSAAETVGLLFVAEARLFTLLPRRDADLYLAFGIGTLVLTRIEAIIEDVVLSRAHNRLVESGYPAPEES